MPPSLMRSLLCLRQDLSDVVRVGLRIKTKSFSQVTNGRRIVPFVKICESSDPECEIRLRVQAKCLSRVHNRTIRIAFPFISLGAENIDSRHFRIETERLGSISDSLIDFVLSQIGSSTMFSKFPRILFRIKT
jgi:hypothetical protein